MSKNGVNLPTSTSGGSALGKSYGNSDSALSSRDDDKAGSVTTLNGELMKSKIFVGGIAQKTTEEELKSFFGAVAHVLDVRIITDNAMLAKNGEPRRYAFVEFASAEDVRKVLATYSEKHSLELDGRRLNVAPAYRRQPTFGRTFGPSSPPSSSYRSYHINQADMTAGFAAGQQWIPPPGSPLPGVGQQVPQTYYPGMPYPYMAPQAYYSGMMPPPPTVHQALQHQYVQAVAAAMMLQQQQQTNSSPLASRTVGQQGSSSLQHNTSPVDPSDLSNSEALAAFMARDDNALQRHQHDMAMDYATQQAMMQQSPQMDFRPSVSGQQPNERDQYRQGSGRARGTGYGQQGTVAPNNEQDYQGSYGSSGRANQVGLYHGRNTGLYGTQSSGRSPSNLVSFPQQHQY
ncbi:hypothetical protein RvY_01475 [Ramazzottius varieornatus]|uniref:RRM domain-containing protein n=1 Tax=Ramazzottius varieornatus TaxID=947166 RepID=A0A1D1UJZ4_RAMVA|nr:hypothetical protein RvY_01475 [Ramazzottius varieornatus]